MLLCALIMSLGFVVQPMSEVQNQPELSLDTIFSDGAFSARSFGPARWLESGSAYVTLETAEGADGPELVRYDCATGARTVILGLDQLVPAGSEKPLRIENYEFEKGEKRLLLFTNGKRVWRSNTRGDYWVVNLEAGTLKQLGDKAPPSSLMFATFSPDGNKVAYVRENNLYVESLSDGSVTALTSDGSKTIVNGTSDWVYEEEFSLRHCFRWSPDSRHIAYWRFDSSGVETFYLINNTKALYPELTAIPYPKAGTTNSAVALNIVSVENGKTTPVAVVGDPRQIYIPRMDWSSPKEIVYQQMNREQQENQVISANLHGEIKQLFTDRDEAWLDVVDDFHWFDDGQKFTWVSESSGWRQLVAVDRNGNTQAVTPSGMDILGVVRVDVASGWVFYNAAPGDPIRRYLYRSRLNGKGKPQRLTPADQPGFHSYQVAPGGKFAIQRYSTFGMPTITQLVSLPDHKLIRTLEDNQALIQSLAKLHLGPVEFFQVPAENGAAMDGWLIKPPNFDPSKQYPLLFFVYGEPWSQTVLDRWWGNRGLFHQMLAAEGYLVASIDNRGTPAPKGREWRKCVYGAIGVLASADQAAGLKAMGKRWSFIDPDRVGIWGWSGGGSMSLNAIFRYPDLYKLAMSVAPVPDQTLYDTIYQERYMGTPQANPDGYYQGSPINFAKNLKGKLLLIHGTGDDNVHYQGSERLINELIKYNKDFEMMAYPNRSHGIFEGENTRRHLYGLLARFLKQHL